MPGAGIVPAVGTLLCTSAQALVAIDLPCWLQLFEEKADCGTHDAASDAHNINLLDWRLWLAASAATAGALGFHCRGVLHHASHAALLVEFHAWPLIDDVIAICGQACCNTRTIRAAQHETQQEAQ